MLTRINRVARLSGFWRNPFSFFFARSRKEETMAAYVIREHERGRALAEILDDPYVRNRCTPQELARLLDRPEVVHALGEGTVAAERERIT
jgi:hypothetical protein